MHPKFLSVIDSLDSSLQMLLAQETIKIEKLKKTVKVQGVYLFTEAGKNLYIGRTNNLYRRYGFHCNHGSQHNQATFAFLLAREETGKVVIGYKPGPTSRKGLIEDPQFFDAFQKAKMRVRKMEFRYVVEPDPIKQALLEIYCAVVLGTPYNSFKTS